MNILAIDSSGITASVALWTDGIIRAEYSVQYQKTHSQTLVPMLEEICRMTEQDPMALDYVAVAGGPGSFTGLRIGAATAKGIAMAAGCPIVNVPTLEGMAMLALPWDGVIVPMIDARRSQVFTGQYVPGHFDRTTDDAGKGCGLPGKPEGALRVIQDQTPMEIRALADLLNDQGVPAFLLGDGAKVYETVLRERLKVPHLFAPAHLSAQRAGAVAVRALDYIAAGKVESAAAHVPEYLRVSQAERVRAEKEKRAE